MRIALIADIHSNLPALEAVLRAIKGHAPDRIVSLGDQVNLGPCPRETLALLRAENVTCLHGNHERYILAAMAGDPAYDGANFASLRFNAGLLTAPEITFPETLRVEGATLCHAIPGDDRFPIYDLAQAIPKLKALGLSGHILCGHGHNPTHIRIENLTVDSIGSVGCMDRGAPGTTSYVIAQIERDAVGLRPYTIAYDTSALPGLFRAGGMAAFCPVMAHIACLQMMHNEDCLVRFVALARALSAQRGEQAVTEQTWQDADARFDWPDGVGTTTFWAGLRR